MPAESADQLIYIGMAKRVICALNAWDHATAGCRPTRKPFRCSSRRRGGLPGYARHSI
jgi:hypothetical protein